MAHIHEKVDFTAEVFVVFSNKVLLRIHDKYKFWHSVGGHIELDEDPNQAAIREVKEEVGLSITLDASKQLVEGRNDSYTELIPPYFINRHRISEAHEHVTFVYFATSTTDRINQLTESELSDGCRWFTKEEVELLENIPDHVRIYALKSLEVLSN